MFGYLSMQSSFQTYKMYRGYRNYYCGTCFGLEKNYGQLSRFLLSNDVALLAIATGCHETPLQERYACFGKCKEKKCVFGGGKWDRMGAINLLLVQEKLKDDRNDDKSLLALLGMLVLGRKFRKAEKHFPKMAEAIAAGYREMYRLEQAGSGIRPIEDAFADMMTNTISSFYEPKEWEITFICGISKWVYYIDALDDYEKDYKKQTFNALKKEDAPTHYEYTRKYMQVIIDDLKYIYDDIAAAVEQIPGDSVEHGLLQSLLVNDIPYRTAQVLSGRKMTKCKIGSVWEGSEDNVETKRISFGRV